MTDQEKKDFAAVFRWYDRFSDRLRADPKNAALWGDFIAGGKQVTAEGGDLGAAMVQAVFDVAEHF